MIKHLLISCLALLICHIGFAQPGSLKKVWRDAATQTAILLDSVQQATSNNAVLVAPRTIERGQLKLVGSRDWTSGFFAGELWMLYGYTQEEKWKQAADKATRLLDKEKWNAGTHDMGFKIYCSYGNGYLYTKDSSYQKVIIDAARTLTRRYNPTIGSIRSWDHNRDKWQFPVIIDNMMNLELLFAATRFTGDSSYYSVAVTHANTTLQHHFREDYSSYHVVEYDTLTGAVRSKATHQGFADSSAWARGQAWGLYGYTLCYRETKDARYLQQADSIAAYIFRHPRLPADFIPYWDYDASNIPNAPRDASAAAITASALHELSLYSQQGARYKKLADQLVKNLTKNYRAPVGSNKGFILLHSTGHLPHNSEIDVPINYADYYYLEALLRSTGKKTWQ